MVPNQIIQTHLENSWAGFPWIFTRRSRRSCWRLRVLQRGKRIGPLDNPPKCEKGNSGENGGTPSVRVPSAVLPYSVPPLLPQRCRVRIGSVRWVRIMNFLTRETGAGAVARFPWNSIGRRCWCRWLNSLWGNRILATLVVRHGGRAVSTVSSADVFPVSSVIGEVRGRGGEKTAMSFRRNKYSG